MTATLQPTTAASGAKSATGASPADVVRTAKEAGAQKAEQYLIKTGIATTAYYGPEAEFYIFNSVRFDQNAHEGYYHIDSEEGIWNSGANGAPNMGHRPRHKEGYFPVPPVDRLQD